MKDGWPEYLDQLEQMFEGVAVDGSTAYVPGSNEEFEEEEYYEEEPSMNVHTPISSNSNKRASSTSTCASSPNKKTKSKSQAIKLMDKVISEQTRIGEDRNKMMERQVELQERQAEMKAIMKRRGREEKRKEEEVEVDLVQQMARDCGVQPHNTRLWYTVLQICKDKKTMTFFKKTDPDARKDFIEFLANVNN